MFKIAVSIYIGLVLFAASIAKADFQNARLHHNQQIELRVSDVSIQPNSDVILLSGSSPTPCLDTVRPVLNLSRDFSKLSIQIFANNGVCMNPLTVSGQFQIAIDLKAYFAELNVTTPTTVEVIIENTSVGTQTFEYDVLPQAFYQFDKVVSGVIEKDHRTNTFFLQSQNSRIQILSRFDLNPYQNKSVRVKGLIPGEVTIGLGVEEVPSQIVIGQLISMK